MKNDTPVKTKIIGLGNPLMGDDGLGPAVIERLAERKIAGVDLLDGGVAGLGLIGCMEDVESVIFVDAALMQTEPGTIRVFRPDEVVSMKPEGSFSLHGMDVLSVLELARAVDVEPEVTVVAVEPFSVEPRYGLSEAMAGIVDAVAEVALRVAKAADPGAVMMEKNHD